MTVHTDIHQLLISRCPAMTRQWHSAIAATSFTPSRAAVVRQRLHDLTRLLIDLLLAEPFVAEPAEQIGAALVDLHYVQPEALRHTHHALSQLLADLPPDTMLALQPRLTALLGALATGFGIASRERILQEQEHIRRALLAERDQKEAELRSSQATTKALLDAIPDLILQVDPAGRCLGYKAGHTDGLNPPPGAVSGQPLTVLWPPEIALEMLYYIGRALESAEPQLFEFQLRSVEAAYEFEARVVPWGTENALVLVRDITQSKRATIALRAREAELRAIFDGAAIGITLTNGQGQFLNTNPAFQQLLGYSGDELRHRLFSDVTHPEDVGLDTSLYHEVIVGKRLSYQLEKRYIHKNGDVRWGHLTLSLLREYDMQPGLALGLVEDITERKRNEQALMHLQKLDGLGVLAGGIAHEFNNILIVILGNVELARLDQPTMPPALHEYVSQIEGAAQRAAELIQQMLMYAGHSSANVHALDLTTLINEMRGLVAVALPKENQVQLDYCLVAALPAVSADASQVRHIIISLVLNAADALERPAGTIRVATGILMVDARYEDTAQLTVDLQPGAYVYLEVTDSGRGMDSRTYTSMFDPFFTTKASGSGLSLAAVLGIVRNHHGAIQVWSQPGMGTTVRVLFPAAPSIGE